jgi:hypothetical protein
VAVFQYTATIQNREEHVESGTVVARDEEDALKKLQRYDLDNAHLRKLGGVSALLKSLTADIK